MPFKGDESTHNIVREKLGRRHSVCPGDLFLIKKVLITDPGLKKSSFGRSISELSEAGKDIKSKVRKNFARSRTKFRF